ncbi:uncharacterized protein LOC100023060 isoform X14 [Monodelphis domestica]|uniref:uncharacterized protein LOC100023060 isoform X14 n=1 Tax=Monodelphis domestica TaxID=13616 RepID=UPI0024E1CE08|nr:uncharacterized protein LOC100023060 isoform X14 [Monodelphis domestica]
MDKALDETWGHKDRRTSPLPRAIVAQEAAESLEPGPKRLTKQLDQRVRTPRARGLFLRLADVQGCGRGLHLGAVGAAAAFSEGALQGGDAGELRQRGGPGTCRFRAGGGPSAGTRGSALGVGGGSPSRLLCRLGG